MKLPNATYLNECFAYAPETGTLIWRERPFAHFEGRNGARRLYLQSIDKFAGRAALNTIKGAGYRMGSLDGATYISIGSYGK